jgi:hypothetical protein
VSQIEEVHDLVWIEEPIRRWDAEGHARLSASVRAAVATARTSLAWNNIDRISTRVASTSFKLPQPGVVTHFLRVSIAAHSRDLPVSPVGLTANAAVAHAAAAVPNHLSAEISRRRFAVWLFDRPGVCRRWDCARRRARGWGGASTKLSSPRLSAPTRAGERRPAHMSGPAARACNSRANQSQPPSRPSGRSHDVPKPPRTPPARSTPTVLRSRRGRTRGCSAPEQVRPVAPRHHEQEHPSDRNGANHWAIRNSETAAVSWPAVPVRHARQECRCRRPHLAWLADVSPFGL